MNDDAKTRAWPGDATPAQRLAEILRVDHAGEYGAVRIYEGQLAILGRSAAAPAIRRMMEQERAHLRAFETMLPAGRVRPTLLTPLWHVAGFALGAGTALMGEKAAMACTAAVEEVIDAHYAAQVEELDDVAVRQEAGDARLLLDELGVGVVPRQVRADALDGEQPAEASDPLQARFEDLRDVAGGDPLQHLVLADGGHLGPCHDDNLG